MTIQTGQALTALRIGADNRLGGVRSFMAVKASSVMTVPSDTDSASALLGAMHCQQGSPGGDLLPELGTWAMLISGLAVVGAAFRRKSLNPTA